MDRFSNVLCLLLIALAVGAISCVSRDSRSAQGELEVIAWEFLEEYEANAVAANLKYKGKEIIISGIASDFYPDNEGDGPIVILRNPWTTNHISCQFSSHYTGVVAGLEKETWVKVAGLADPRDWFRIFLRNCRLLEQGTALEALDWIPAAKVPAATARDTVYTQGDLVERLLLLRATGTDVHLLPVLTGTPYSISKDEFLRLKVEPSPVLAYALVQLHLHKMVEAELVRHGAETEGAVVTDEDVDAILRAKFYPGAPKGLGGTPRQLDEEYQEHYQSFLAEAQITDKEYRALVSGDAYRFALREALSDRIPTHVDHTNISWIQVPHEVPDPDNPPPTPEDILKRLGTENFAALAGEIGGGSGPMGWVPKGAYLELDDALYGPRPLRIGEISAPIIGQNATYILTVIAGPEVRELDEMWFGPFKEQLFEEWISQQWESGQQDGWLSLHAGHEQYRWVADYYQHILEEELGIR